MKISLKVILLLLLGLTSILAYKEINDYNQLMAYHQEYSQYPIVHVYHNKHFSKSRQFADFLDVLEQTEYRNMDYAKFILTDCQKFKQGDTYACDQMRTTKDNRMIVGYYPTDQFVNYGGKKMQNPPKNRQLNHPLDVYTVSEIQNFIEEMIPNFYQELSSFEKYKEWLKPKYSPKLIFASRQDDIPLVLKKIGVNYFLRFDLGYVSDLTENVIKELNITSFPTLLVVKANFEKNIFQTIAYDGIDFSSKHYEKIKTFLEPYALKTPRNDILFHKMKFQPDQGIIEAENKAQVEEILNRAHGWVLVSSVTAEPLKLKMLRERYGRFFQYLHFVSGNQTEEIQIYDPEQELMHSLDNDQVHFKTMKKDEFLQNMGLWTKRNYVMIVARQKYGHICAIALSSFFRGLTQCLIVNDEDYSEVSAALNMEFDIGFSCYQAYQDSKFKIIGRNFKDYAYEDIYLNIEYLTRLKSKEIVDDFFDNPIKKIIEPSKLTDICAFPFKKCALLFTHSHKADRTAYDYLKEVAVNFINQYQFYEIDLQCNPQFQKQIDSLTRQTSGLIVYHPKKSSYVSLKAKLSKSTFQKFLRANLNDNKKLPFHQFSNKEIKVHKCSKQAEVVKQREEDASL